MNYQDEAAELLVTKLPLRRRQRVKREVEEACATMIGSLATMLDVGPRKGSKWTPADFNAKVKGLADDYIEIFGEAFGREEDETESR